MSKHETFRPKGNAAWAAVAFTLDALFLIQIVWFPSEGNNFVNMAIVALVAVITYLLWVKPKLVLRADDLVIVNPLKTVVVKYSEITDLQTKWTLTVFHTTGKVNVWVAPANGKSRWIAESTFRWRNSRVPLTGEISGDVAPISQSTRSDSGLAAELIRQRLKH